MINKLKNHVLSLLMKAESPKNNVFIINEDPETYMNSIPEFLKQFSVEYDYESDSKLTELKIKIMGNTVIIKK